MSYDNIREWDSNVNNWLKMKFEDFLRDFHEIEVELQQRKGQQAAERWDVNRRPREIQRRIIIEERIES